MSEGPAQGGPALSIVVLSWNTEDLLAACLGSLEALRDELVCEVIVVDNASSDGSADMVASRFPWTTLVRNERNDGYAIGNNLGAARTTGEFLLLLNSDTEVGPGVLTRLVGFLEQHTGHGACSPRLQGPDGQVQLSCKTFPGLMTAVFFDTYFDRWFPKNRTIPRYSMSDFDHLGTRDVDQPPGAALMIRRSLWNELGGFDPELWLFFNDVDLCRRTQELGWKIAYLGDVSILHHEGKSTSQFHRMGAIWHKNRMAYYRKTFGLGGTLLARVMTTVRGFEEARKLKRAGAPREAVADVWNAVRETWTS